MAVMQMSLDFITQIFVQNHSINIYINIHMYIYIDGFLCPVFNTIRFVSIINMGIDIKIKVLAAL